MPDKIIPLTPEELQEAHVLLNPWLFAEAFLQDPSKPQYPLILRPYQREILKDRHYRKILRMGRRCVAATDTIYTPKGKLTFADLLDSHPTIWTLDTKNYKIIETTNYDVWDNGVQDTMVLTTVGNNSQRVTYDHPFLVPFRDYNKDGSTKLIWVEAQDLSLKDSIATVMGIESSNPSISFEKISDLSDALATRTIDLHVPDSHCFIGNKIISHNTGKSVVLAIEAVFRGFTYSHRQILIVTAYEGQLDEIFNAIDHLCFDSTKIRDSITRVTLKPHKVEFKNGSVISGNVGNNSVRGKCLPSGTQIWMGDLTWKSIENVQVGDMVFSYDIEKDIAVPKPVEAVHHNGIKPIFELSTKSSRFLRATEEHRVFNVYGEYVKIKDLKTWKTHQNKADFIASIGIDVTISTLDGSRTQGFQLQFGRAHNIIELQPQETHDLTVADNHNFVAMHPPGKEFSGFSVSGAANGGILVHNSADDLIIDECDYIPKSILLEAIWPIATTRRDTNVILSSTPTGRHEFFYDISRNKDNPAFDFHEFHIKSNKSPEWTPEHEALIKATMDSIRYTREMDAEFGESSEGVFRNKYIEPSLFVYNYDSLKNDSNNYLTMGVDWNEAAAGVRIMILEHIRVPTTLQPYNSGDYKKAESVTRHNFLMCRDHYSISAEDYTNTTAIDFILKLFRKYNINYACFDKGHGHTNWELLRLAMQRGVSSTGYRCGKMSGMLERMEVIDSGSTSEVIDVTTNQTSKVRTKNLIVRDAVKLLENGRYVIPAVDKNGNTIELESNRLVGQMRNYSVIRTTDKGEVFSSGNDHTLDAWILASHAFLLNHDKFITWTYSTEATVVQSAGLTPYSVSKRSLTQKLKTNEPTISKHGEITIRDFGLYPKQGEPPEDDVDSYPTGLNARRSSTQLTAHTPRKTDI